MAEEKGKMTEFPANAINQFPKMTIYFGKDKEDLLNRFKTLAAKVGGNVSSAGLITACMEVCIDTLETEAVNKRRFKLNGRNVVV